MGFIKYMNGLRKISVYCVVMGLTFFVFGQNSALATMDLPSKCGFATRAELLSTAKEIVARFMQLELDALGLQKPDLKSAAPPVDISSEIDTLLTQISSSPVLAAPRSAQLLQVVYDDTNSACQGLPCALPNSFMVMLSPSWLIKFRQAVGSRFHKSMLTILAHEMGHHVYNPIFRIDPDYPRVSSAGPLTPLRYHLTVDAIGTLLIGGQISDVITALSDTVATTGIEGDVRDRLECLNGLPDGP